MKQVIMAGVAEGALRPIIGREMPLADAAAANVAVLAPGAYGKIVLVPWPFGTIASERPSRAIASR